MRRLILASTLWTAFSGCDSTQVVPFKLAPVKILYLEHDDPVKLIDFPPGVDHNAHPWCKLKIGSAGVVEQIIDSGKMIAVVFPEVSGFVAVPPACLDLIA